MIQIYSNSLGNEELNAIEEVFKSKWLGKGPKTDEFIKNISSKLITENAFGVAFSNASPKNLTTVSCCTEGIFQILDLIDLQPNDEVILPSISFVGVANAILYKKSKPIFCDVDKHTLNPTVEHIKEKITPNTKAVIVIHYAGVPCDIENISKLCKENNITLIEDNANSPFSRYNNKNTGTFGDFGVWSFDAMKILVTGDGGLIYAQKQTDIEKLKRLTYLGLETPSGLSNTIDKKWWKFEVSTPGRRSITNDIQAAIGIEQLKKVDNFIARRKEIYEMYSINLSKLDWIKLPSIPNGINSSYYMYHIQVKNRDEFAKYLKENNIYTTFRYYPLHWVDFYQSKESLPNTEYAANHTLCLPIHQNLTNKEVNYIIDTIKKWKKYHS
jgi:dTDP-4-amino-4,6-dideoxygalactose transaminase